MNNGEKRSEEEYKREREKNFLVTKSEENGWMKPLVKYFIYIG